MSDQAAAIAEKNFSILNGELYVAGLAVTQLAETYGTPLFVYDISIMDRQLDALRSALPSQFSICYSMKANPNPAIVRHFFSRGCGIEIASDGEFLTAQRAGCDPKTMLFAGPGKTPAELELVLSQGIGEIHAESLIECGRISAICKRLGKRAHVAIRVNPTGDAAGGAMRMGGRAAPFGVDEETLDSVLVTLLNDPNVAFSGIHLFTGTQILDAAVLLNQYRHGVELGRRVAQVAGRPLDTLDFGGGLGIPYFSHEKDLDLQQLKEGLSVLFADLESDPWLKRTRFLVEPGRFLVGESGVYIARVNDIKISRGKKFLILDGGMNHHLAASGNLGQTIKRNYPVAILNKLDAKANENVDAVGPLCTPLDTVARNVTLPAAEIGDLFGVFQSGAYGRSSSPLGFLSHAAPPEILIRSGRAELIECRGGGTAA